MAQDGKEYPDGSIAGSGCRRRLDLLDWRSLVREWVSKQDWECGFAKQATLKDSPAAPIQTQEEHGMSEIRTLIVDDSTVMRKIVERSLRQAGLDPLIVYEAGSGTEGLDMLRTKTVDLILSDINMPSMDGLEFLRQLRAQNLAPGVPVVMITTESSEEHVKQAILAGAQGYIRKPFTAEQVKERVLPLINAA
jgi:two-component system chemotaxis response regulator CheY